MVRVLLLSISVTAYAWCVSAAEVPMETTFDSFVEFFSAFNDHAVGSHLYDSTLPSDWKELTDYTFVNKVKSAYFAKFSVKGTGGFYVTNDAPGKYIYSSLAAKRPLAVDPCGIRHDFNGSANAVYMYLNGLAKPLGTASGHTVEMFFKLDRTYSGGPIMFYYDPYPGDNKNRVIVWLQSTSGKHFKLQNLGSEAPLSDDGNTYKDLKYDDVSTLVNDGHWHHLAVVYKAEWAGVRLYCDYTLVSGIVSVNIADNSNQLRIGDNKNGFPGLTSAVRVSTAALEPAGFLRASNNSDGPSQNEECYLYPFNEEAVGTVYTNTDPATANSYGTKFKGYNAKGDITVNGYVKGFGIGEISAESPGQYLYSDVYSKVPVAVGVKSYRQHNPDLNSTASYSFLQLVSASHRLARYGTHTLEFFWKSETFHTTLDMAYWDLVKETSSPAQKRRYALQMGTSSAAEFIKLWTLTDGSVPSEFVDIPYAGYKTSSTTETGLADGKWHHIAVVYDAASGGAKLYCDYALTSETRVSLGDLTGLALPNTTCELRYGSYKWDSYLSAVRISKGALTPDRFLYASDSPDCALPKAGVAWRLDGAAGGAVAETNVNAAAKQYVHTIAAGAKGDAVVTGSATYSADCRSGQRIIGGVRGMSNQGAAALSAGASLRSSGLGPLVSSASAFTVQALVKATARPASGAASILAQADAANDYAWALVTLSDGRLAFKAKLVGVDGTTTDWELASSATLPLNDWHHVAVTCDKESGTVKLYLDYHEVAASASTAGQILCGNDSLVAGSVGSFTTIDGFIDEVMFNREILSDSDFQRINLKGLVVIFR